DFRTRRPGRAACDPSGFAGRARRGDATPEPRDARMSARAHDGAYAHDPGPPHRIGPQGDALILELRRLQWALARDREEPKPAPAPPRAAPERKTIAHEAAESAKRVAEGAQRAAAALGQASEAAGTVARSRLTPAATYAFRQLQTAYHFIRGH